VRAHSETTFLSSSSKISARRLRFKRANRIEAAGDVLAGNKIHFTLRCASAFVSDNSLLRDRAPAHTAHPMFLHFPPKTSRLHEHHPRGDASACMLIPSW
jgi:hypothetical protein